MPKKCVTQDLWSPTVEDFDRLIEEQGCFEIFWRQEQVKNQKLTEELNKAKRSLRSEMLAKEKEIERLRQKLLAQEDLITNLQRLNEEQRKEFEILKVNKPSESPPPQKKKIRHKVPDVAAQAEQSLEQSNEHPPQQPSSPTQKDSPTTQIPIDSTSVAFSPTRKFRKTASLVAQLVQGFEAVAAATNQERINENMRRSKTVAVFRPALTLPGESTA